MEMALIGCMMYHSFLRYLALSFKHTTVLEKEIAALATTLFLLQKHQNNSISDI
jgi:hypothetical protein